MSSTEYYSQSYTRGPRTHGGMRFCSGGHWSGANIAAMVFGFVFFAPLGILFLIWTMMGRPIQELPAWIREKWTQVFGGGGARSFVKSENIVFNEYQQAQYDRIQEIKDEIRKRAEAFRAYRFDAKRRKDQKEFDNFMASDPDKGSERA